MTMHSFRRRAVAMAAVGALALTGCGSDEPEEAAAPAESSEPEAVESSEPEEMTEPEAMEPGTYDVVASDYAFTGIPAEMAAGSTINFSNSSEVEVHEIVGINFGDDERPLFDILVEMQAALEGGDTSGIIPALVVIEGPGGEPRIPAIGDGTLAEPGRYIFICAIQQGADPAAYFAEAARMQEAGEEGPVFLEDAGDPHAVLGMVGETRVT